MRVFISGASTPIQYQTGVHYKRAIDTIGNCTISIADDKFSAYNTYKSSHFDLLTIVDDDWNPEYVRLWDNTAGTFSDVTTEATADASTFNLYGHTGNSETGDIVYVGRDEAFDYCRFDVATLNDTSPNTYVIEYWGGSWKTQSTANDDTNDGQETFEKDGIITWVRQGDWVKTTVSGVNAFWVRFRISSADTDNPTANRVNAGPYRFVKFKVTYK